LQRDFLKVLDNRFGQNAGLDAVIPHGHASFALIRGRYGFHDPYFMTSRCTAYRRDVLVELKGFMDHFIGQEDVEFVIRFLMAGKHSENVADLNYFHPPLLVPNFRKPRSVGHSFYGLRSKYPLATWLIVIFNCSRQAPLYLLPIRRCREMGRFGIGFFAGVLVSLFKKKGFQYN
jgi:GT2 family glycosyltransferase